MNTEVRFIAAIGLMIAVLVGTNILFPPVEPELPLEATDSIGAEATTTPSDFGAPSVPESTAAPEGTEGEAAETSALPAVERRQVVVEGPLFRHTFDNYGAALVSAELLSYASLSGGSAQGSVELVPEGTRTLAKRLVLGNDTLSLDDIGFEVTPAGGLTLQEGGSPQTLTFSYTNPTGAFTLAFDYTFDPSDYEVAVQARVSGLERPLLLTSLGDGIAYNEADSVSEARAMAWVANGVNTGIESTEFRRVDEPELVPGPLRWAAYRSRYFVTAIHPGATVEDTETYLGGAVVTPLAGESVARIETSQVVGLSGTVDARIYLGPQVYSRLQAYGTDFEDVNPFGWRWLRPVLRPIVSGILWLFNFLHDSLNIGYGWVLVLFGVMMRVVLWPLNQKAMRAQFRNMAVQPLLKEIQTKYKDNPEKLQKEMMKLYKEYGFNPLAGCLPLFIPWPVLIALFFVFQNTIELRGVSFMWLPDLSAKDPIFILPLILAVSMFLLQWISFRSMPEANPQMKTMMWVMPPVFGFIFLQFPAGLNLYYAVSNIATLPQQILIANERKKHAGKAPVKLSDQGGGAGASADKSAASTGSASASGSRKSRKNRKKK